MEKTDHKITCSQKEIKKIRMIARSRTAGIWRTKRAKVILGALEGKSIDRLVLDVRVPPETIKKCLKSFPFCLKHLLIWINFGGRAIEQPIGLKQESLKVIVFMELSTKRRFRKKLSSYIHSAKIFARYFAAFRGIMCVPIPFSPGGWKSAQKSW